MHTGHPTNAGRPAPNTAPAASTGRLNALGVQLYTVRIYTVRTLMQDDFEGTLQAVAEVGYDEVEFAGYYDRPPSEVKELLDELGHAAPSTHVPLGQLRY